MKTSLKYSLAVLKGKIEYYKRAQRGEQPALERDLAKELLDSDKDFVNRLREIVP